MTTKKQEYRIPHQTKLKVMRILIEAQGKCLNELQLEDTSTTLSIRVFDFLSRARNTIDSARDSGCDCVVERECDEPLSLAGATAILSDGHAILSPRTAWRVCKAVGVEYQKDLEYHGFTDFQFKGLTMANGKEGIVIVDSLNLSDYIVDKLGIQVESKIGRGSQARVNAEAIKAKLEKLAGA